MEQIKILWADDEIDLLKPQLMFLKKKGYEVITVTNGYDAIEECDEDNEIDIVFLDENIYFDLSIKLYPPKLAPSLFPSLLQRIFLSHQGAMQKSMPTKGVSQYYYSKLPKKYFHSS